MNIRTVKKKTKSVVNVRKITKAMQLVSAFKMRKSQQAAVECKPFQEHLETIIAKVIRRVSPSYSQLISPTTQILKNERELIIFITSNKGLCGGYNFNLFNFLIKNADVKKTDFIVLGKKGSLFIYKIGGKILADYSSATPLANVSAIFNLVLQCFLSADYSQVSLIYNHFVNTLKCLPVKQTILPISGLEMKNKVEDMTRQYLIEPSAKKIIDPLLRSFVEEKIRFAIIESEASEHSSRMIAMKNATDNANDVIYNLTLLTNKLRQEKITNELLDMVTAKESVEG